MPVDAARFAALLSAIASRQDRDAFAELFAFYAPHARLPARLQTLPALSHVEVSGTYHFCLLRIEDAQRLARPRSTRWGTYGFKWAAFCRAALPASVLVAQQPAG